MKRILTIMLNGDPSKIFQIFSINEGPGRSVLNLGLSSSALSTDAYYTFRDAVQKQGASSASHVKSRLISWWIVARKAVDDL
jgi:hypothetical protein